MACLFEAEGHPVHHSALSRNVSATRLCRICWSSKCSHHILVMAPEAYEKRWRKFPLKTALQIPGKRKNHSSRCLTSVWWLVNTHETLALTLYMDSLASLKGLTLWLRQWEAEGQMIMNKPLWKDIWVYLQESEVVLTVFHVLVHKVLPPAGCQEANALVCTWPLSRYSRFDA